MDTVEKKEIELLTRPDSQNQNSMAELWSLLHFVMPTLFDSHEEFNDWFSKDIESSAESKSQIDERKSGKVDVWGQTCHVYPNTTSMCM